MADPASARLVVTHRYAASPERVFDAFLDVAVARRFLFATPSAEMVTAEIDPRVGGRFTFAERRPDGGEVRHVGAYLEIERPRAARPVRRGARPRAARAGSPPGRAKGNGGRIQTSRVEPARGASVQTIGPESANRPEEQLPCRAGPC